MIRYILEFLKQNKLMGVVEKDAREMLELAHTIFQASSNALLEGKPVDFDLYAKDREINLRVINTRKRIVEHLSLSKCDYPVGELVMIILVNNIERIGDHSKNMYDLFRRLDGPVEETFYLPMIKKLHKTIDGFFPKAKKALFEDDENAAREVMDGHLAVVKTCKGLMSDLLNDDEISARQAVALAITIRSLKRISAHLKTISSSAVSPFMLMGFTQMPEIKGVIEDAD